MFRSRILLFVAAAGAAFAQTTPPQASGIAGFSGSISFATGGALVEGDRGRYQLHQQQRKSGFIGIEELTLTREIGDSTLTLEGHALYGNEDYRIAVKWVDPEKGFIAAGAESYRVFYDASGGYFRPTDLAFDLFDDAVHVNRGRIWFEAGVTRPELPQFTFRYERQTRSGKKGSTAWGDTNLVGAPYGTRNIVPSYWRLDETRDLFSIDISQSTEQQEWKIGGRYEHSEFSNDRNMRRRPFEATADRTVTQKEAMTTDMFSLHGYVQHRLNERLLFSTGALVTRLDTDLGGSRIYGQSYDPVFDPAYARRQQRDEGFFHLTGGSNLRQYVAHLNLDYRPTKKWQIRPAVRFERTRTESISEFMETNVVTAGALVHEEEAEGESDREWNEVMESIEARYTGRPNWTFSLRGEWLQGDGNLDEHRVILETGSIGIDRETDLERFVQKYSASANWYAAPNLTFALQYYWKGRVNDYDTERDNTPNTLTSADRYPGYITDQDFETNDVNLRMTWRATPFLSLTSRYDYQRSFVRSTEAGLGEVISSVYRSHIFSESVMLNPIPRLYLTAGLNVAFDQIYTPASGTPFVKNGDNNYLDASVGGGYAVSDRDDLYFDFGHYHAKNFVDNSAFSLPFGANERREAASATWVRKQTENLIYTLKYTFVTYRDRGALGRQNDYDAHIGYAKVQYRF